MYPISTGKIIHSFPFQFRPCLCETRHRLMKKTFVAFSLAFVMLFSVGTAFTFAETPAEPFSPDGGVLSEKDGEQARGEYENGGLSWRFSLKITI